MKAKLQQEFSQKIKKFRTPREQNFLTGSLKKQNSALHRRTTVQYQNKPLRTHQASIRQRKATIEHERRLNGRCARNVADDGSSVESITQSWHHQIFSGPELVGTLKTAPLSH